VPVVRAMVEAFCGDAHMSLEGDLFCLRWEGGVAPHPRIAALLRRQTIWPRQSYAVLPLEPPTISEIVQNVLPRIGLRRRVIHVQIEKHRRIVFAAYDQFHQGCVVVAQSVGTELLDRLVRERSLKSYYPCEPESRTDGVTNDPDQAVVSRLLEQDVSLREVLQEFDGDVDRARRMLQVLVGTGSAILKDGGGIIPYRKARELMNAPAFFQERGDLNLTPAPIPADQPEPGHNDEACEVARRLEQAYARLLARTAYADESEEYYGIEVVPLCEDGHIFRLYLTFKCGHSYCCVEPDCHFDLWTTEGWSRLREELSDVGLADLGPLTITKVCILVEEGALVGLRHPGDQRPLTSAGRQSYELGPFLEEYPVEGGQAE
jgi:hypothetical protein